MSRVPALDPEPISGGAAGTNLGINLWMLWTTSPGTIFLRHRPGSVRA